ncbi:Nif11-like leader peptide family natural product precursor [Ruminococcus sp. NK3A76]|uniref:Nif11-like leader peptide family natural product precursor n=1 Tax=Ruminococcus sp. NK3A76 TaxID=877411 RepID=UPI00049016A3|nr:Nif11-like leader peptide family natural product precursor [Ruminococcus sp. NK3A76]
MTNEFNLEEYIKDLSPELQEKARQCKTKDELIQLAAEENVEIPMEALEGVAGGCTSKGCEHSFQQTERIGMLPYVGSNDKNIMYNGKVVNSLITRVCSKCGETHYFIEPAVSLRSGYGTILIQYIEISQSEYNALKAQKTW